MHRLIGTQRSYHWGSTTAIPELLGITPPDQPLAEMWWGSHADAPAGLAHITQEAHRCGHLDLRCFIAHDPLGCLGADVVSRFGPNLPYLLKLIAPARPLSLQVHPTIERARARYLDENRSGVALDDPRRNYRDDNHKPELVYALTTFEALCGFRAPRRAAEVLAGLNSSLARQLRTVLVADPTPDGMRAAFSTLLTSDTRPSAAQLNGLAEACRRRLDEGSPSPRTDSTVVTLAAEYPGDPGVAASLLLNPVTLQPGESLFVPAGGVHAYLRGLGIEIMAASDNVLRAGLTPKHVDIPELLECVDYVAAPPIRPEPEVLHDTTKMFYAPVDDFELSISHLRENHASTTHPLPGRGPRTLLCLRGSVTVISADEAATLNRGEALFVRADEGALSIKGMGTIVQADVP